MTEFERATTGPTTFERLAWQRGSIGHLTNPETEDPPAVTPSVPAYRSVPADWPVPAIGLGDFAPVGADSPGVPGVSGEPLSLTPAERTDAALADYRRAVAERDVYPGRVDSTDYRAAVDAAEAELEEAVRAELRSDPVHPPSAPRSGEEIRRRAELIVRRHADDPVAIEKIRGAAEPLAVDAEVTDTLRAVDAADTPEQALTWLNEGLSTASPEARARLLEDASVERLLDGIADHAIDLLADLDDSSYSLEGRVRDALIYLDERLPEGTDPELAVALLQRVQPAFDRAIEANLERSRDWADIDAGDNPLVLLDAERFGVLVRLSDLVDEAENGQPVLEGLARLGDQANRMLIHENDSLADGRGLALTIEIARLAEADPNRDGGDVLDSALDAFDAYVNDPEGPVATSLAAYAEHTAEFTFLVANFPPGLPPSWREEMIDDYLDGKDATWKRELARLERDIAVHGANALELREGLANLPPELASHSVTTDGRLREITGTHDFQLAVSTAANGHLDLLSGVDLDEAIDFFNAASTADGTVSLAESLADARFQGTIADALGDLDPLDVATVRDARRRIDELRTPAIAQAWGISGEELDTVLDGLLDTLPDSRGRFVSLDDTRASLTRLDTALEGIDRFGARDPMGIAIRSFAVAGGLVATYDSARSFVEDPSVEEGARTLLDAAGLAEDVVDLTEQAGIVGRDGWLVSRFGADSTLRKLLGKAGIALAVFDTFGEFKEGDLLQGGAGIVGLSGALIGGPWGLGIALGAAVFSIGVDQYRKSEASNDFTGEEGDAARAALRHAGLSERSAAALVDRSGDGHSPVPVLMRYGELKGLTPLQTIGWINSLTRSELDTVRDTFHHFLDENGGDASVFTRTSDRDDSLRAILASEGHIPPYSVAEAISSGDAVSAASADLLLEYLGIDVPTPPDAPYARPRIA